MATCPTCNGAKQVLEFRNTGEDYTKHTSDYVVCKTCGGRGTIGADKAAVLADLEQMRAARVARGESLREAAERMGITVKELCDIEHGRKTP